MGSIALAKLGSSHGVIGLHWMMEDFRHSGIGIQLFKYAMRVLNGRNVCINTGERLFIISYLFLMLFCVNVTLQYLICPKKFVIAVSSSTRRPGASSILLSTNRKECRISK